MIANLIALSLYAFKTQGFILATDQKVGDSNSSRRTTVKGSEIADNTAFSEPFLFFVRSYSFHDISLAFTFFQIIDCKFDCSFRA